ncbi:MAG: tyrosine-protein phosphatase, partial [Lachnospiraceae bacterium]|nr:tyrosine-protein phosphatase [Lachnospiraceae bacterium]
MTAENNKNILYPAGTEIPFDGAVNFRELGGYRTGDGRMVKYGCFYRGGNLDALTGEADRKKLGELKLKMVLDLRSNGESEMHPDPVLDGVKQVRKSAIFFPDGSEVDFSPKGIGKLEAIMKEMEKKFGKEMAFAQLYKIMPFGNPAFQELFRALEEDDIPILFH